MKKKYYSIMGFAAIGTAIAFTANIGLRSSGTLSDITLANVEALAQNESGDDCNYVNGYTKFINIKGGAYDCCKIWRDMSPYNDKCQ